MGSAKVEPSPSMPKSHAKPYGEVVITLKNQLLPEEKLSPTPSQNDGLDIETETDLRIYGCELIQTAGILLKLPQVAMATGQVLLQRFYYSKSLVRHPVDHTAMACVCLASKIEEVPRRVRDVINVFTHIRQVNSNKTIQPVILDANYIQLKNLVIKAERRVLKELGFCVHIKHPHKIIVMYLQVLNHEKNKQLMQYSWNYMNDSLRTDVFVRYQPETVACACIYLTARKLQLPLPKNPAWYSIFRASEAEIKDIAVKILKLYNRPKPNIEALEKKVEELCKKYHDARVKARGIGALSGGANSGNNTPNNDSNHSPSNHHQQQHHHHQKTTGAHNAWGGFISRSGSHVAPPVQSSDSKRSRSRSPNSHSPSARHKRSSKKHRASSRSPPLLTQQQHRNHGSSGGGGKKNHKRKSSYSRSRSNSPHKRKSSKSEKRRSTTPTSANDREPNKDRYIDRYEKERERYDDKRDRHDKYKERERDSEKYSKKSSKHDKDRERSKDRRR